MIILYAVNMYYSHWLIIKAVCPMASRVSLGRTINLRMPMKRDRDRIERERCEPGTRGRRTARGQVKPGSHVSKCRLIETG